MKARLWYRCAMCSPGQSIDFEVEGDMPVSEAYRLVFDHHALNSPDCKISAAGETLGRWVTVDFLIRMIQ